MKFSQRTLLIMLPVITIFLILGPYVTYIYGKEINNELVVSQSIDATDFCISMILYAFALAITLAIFGVTVETFKAWMGLLVMLFIAVFTYALFKALQNKGINYPFSLKLVRKLLRRTKQNAP